MTKNLVVCSTFFLRGMSQKIRNSGGEGVFFKRPTWQELKGYENRLCLENY